MKNVEFQTKSHRATFEIRSCSLPTLDLKIPKQIER